MHGEVSVARVWVCGGQPQVHTRGGGGRRSCRGTCHLPVRGYVACWLDTAPSLTGIVRRQMREVWRTTTVHAGGHTSSWPTVGDGGVAPTSAGAVSTVAADCDALRVIRHDADYHAMSLWLRGVGVPTAVLADLRLPTP